MFVRVAMGLVAMRYGGAHVHVDARLYPVHCVDAELVNTQALERAGSQRSQPDEVLRRLVRPVTPTGQSFVKT